MVLERNVQKIHPGCWEALEAMNARWDALEARYGFPQKRRYRLIIGGDSVDTLVVEREWESMAAWEKTFFLSGYLQDPEYLQLDQESRGVIDNLLWEAYLRLP